MSEYLTEQQAQDLAAECIADEGPSTPTQEILDSGIVPELKGFKVIPGKVSDSLRGGKFTFYDKSAGKEVEEENPSMTLRDGRDARAMVRTAGISTHDVVRGTIPFKDQILAANHDMMRRNLARAMGTSQVDIPGLDSNAIVILSENLGIIPIEFVLRGYMAKSSTSTSLYQHYSKGDREFCGHPLPEGLITNGKLPYLMDTPSTKDPVHDVSVAPEVLFKEGYCTPEEYRVMLNRAVHGYGIGEEILHQRGLILVDTKFEFGKDNKGNIKVIDELLTQDSSRFWQEANYEEQLERLAREEIETLAPISFSKELARGMAKGEDGFTDEQRVVIGGRYIMGSQHLLDKPFGPDMRPRDERTVDGLKKMVAMVDIGQR